MFEIHLVDRKGRGQVAEGAHDNETDGMLCWSVSGCFMGNGMVDPTRADRRHERFGRLW